MSPISRAQLVPSATVLGAAGLRRIDMIVPFVVLGGEVKVNNIRVTLTQEISGERERVQWWWSR